MTDSVSSLRFNLIRYLFMFIQKGIGVDMHTSYLIPFFWKIPKKHKSTYYTRWSACVRVYGWVSVSMTFVISRNECKHEIYQFSFELKSLAVDQNSWKCGIIAKSWTLRPDSKKHYAFCSRAHVNKLSDIMI